MILSQISFVDCVVFLFFLTPQLIVQVGILYTVTWVLGALPFLAIRLPIQFFEERFLRPRSRQSPFVQQATLFQDFVIRCVRYAFAFMPAKLGRVFFSKPVALPFLRWRLLRHGYLRKPLQWREIRRNKFRGVWIPPDDMEKPDIVIYYCHGGGFSMGSSYFYMEFLLAWVALLQEAGYKSPALFALEYTLVPDETYPFQVQETLAGYEHVLSLVDDPSRICIGGDSAGATLVLSMLLLLGDHPQLRHKMPGMASMISPWVTIISDKNRDTESDYLAAHSLAVYGKQYIGSRISKEDPMVSPGMCKDVSRWARSSPTYGWSFSFGSEEVLGPEIRDLIQLLKKGGANIDSYEEPGSIHAWPVASLYLGRDRGERLKGLREIVQTVSKRIPVSGSPKGLT
ncbi:alpha/beta-hydrolase [Aulographum hederae CBS 113979]|uniref:Alpha/beta-hydrolase n=1 Tax=Aulographum hederae CBS 113979 TaxID=1176131 RepID=A0A6G1HDE2_9PEZI|nr:alpha/beta-hydrolase [Aulographum hederae CBS 113979]